MPAARRFRDITNVNLGTLNASKNKNLVRYNASTGEYNLVPMDSILVSEQVLDNQDLPNTFVDTIEEQIDAANLEFRGIDGGSF